MIYIGIDFGGTKIEGAALLDDGRFLSRIREPTPTNYDDALTLVADLVRRVEAEAQASVPSFRHRIATVGIGSPGSIAPETGVMHNANSTYLNGRSFREDLEERVGRPIRMANDGNCLALSEALDGAGHGASSVFAVIVGTGCGGGLVIDQHLVEGRNGIAGEWGHNPLPWATPEEHPGPMCWCGQSGCIETWISGTGFARDYYNVTGQKTSGEAVIAAMRTGDPQASAAFDRLLSRLGRSLAMIVNILDPEVMVFGGGLSNVHEIYDRLPGHIAPYIFGSAHPPKLVPARWNDSSGVRGAAYLWSQRASTAA